MKKSDSEASEEAIYKLKPNRLLRRYSLLVMTLKELLIGKLF
ncbi:hypothetical protein [Tenacibaculum sp. SZ-18]|nr:hypothetical protein [Tenacibaculum sp. SZ-18]